MKTINKIRTRNVKVKGISHKEIKIISELEFNEKRYFRREDIQHLFKNKREMTNAIYNLAKKERIVALNKNKYFLFDKTNFIPFILFIF